ncbi:MAG: TetR/AcrR family transcriptional regulator [Promethearchaeota archaeon]|jgi:AcrR family transcriptional regulator
MTTILISTKEKILAVTEDLIENLGYVNVSARNIAKEAGISVGTLYHHFPQGKMEIVIKIGEKYSEILGMSDFLADPDADPRTWLRKNLELNQKKKAFITAMEIEAMSRPDEVQALIIESIEKRKETQKGLIQAYKMMERFAGKKISIEKAKTMQKVLKAIMRRHIVFGNLFGSDDEFIDLFLKIAQVVAED